MRHAPRLPRTVVIFAAVTSWSAFAALAVERVRTVPPPPAAAAGDATPAPADPARAETVRGQLTVTVDRAKVIRLPERTQTVIVGNPAIADVSIQKNGVVVVTGKSYGVTNLIALDSSGNLLAESVLGVSAPVEALVTVQRGMERQSLSCTPNCMPSVTLGDAQSFFSENKGQAEAHNQFATQR